MPETHPGRVIRFGIFQVDPRAGELWKKGFRVKLQDQPLQILLALLEKPGDVVTREELRAKLWPTDTFVDFDHGLNAAVKRLRDALDDSAESPRFIETLPRRGYRFISTIVADTIHAEQHWSLPKKWVLPLGVGAPVVIALVVLAMDAGGLRSRFFSRSFAQPQIHSLAVLPLTNLSGVPDQEYFADAMTDELIGELSRLSALKVISRTSVMQYKGEKKKSLSQIGRELNVDAVVEGSVLRSGNQVRIAAHMIYAPTDQNLLTETYEGELGDVLKLQREVASTITQKVKLKLTAGEKARLRSAPAVNPEAYQTYLQATYLDWGAPHENEKARSYIEKAIQEDPGFAQAYAGLAATYCRLAEARWRSPQDAYPPAKQAIRKALDLDEKSCRAHATLASIAWRYDWDWQTTEKEFLHCLELCPNAVGPHWDHAYYLAWNGRVAEAMAEVEKCRELDPVRSEPLWIEAATNYHFRNYKALVASSRSFTMLSPNRWFAHYWLGVGYEGSGQLREAIPEYQKAIELSQGDEDATAALAHAYAAMGKRGEAEKILHQFLEQSGTRYVSPYMIGTVYASLGDKDKAFEYLEKAYREKSSDLPYFLRADLRVDNLRSDPRFQDLLRRMNFPQ